jgi:hypothetical protein
MKTNFISYIEKPLPVYSENWYGTFDHCPNAIIELYDDNEAIAVGYTDLDQDILNLSQSDSRIKILTEAEYIKIFLDYENKIDQDSVYFGDKLMSRWQEPIEEGNENGEQI